MTAPRPVEPEDATATSWVAEEWSEGPVTPPERDPFYTAPDGWETVACGTVLRTRPVRLALFGRLRQRIDSWQLLFRTRDLENRPHVSVTTVLLPADSGRGSAGGRPLLSYQCAIDAVSGRSFPSYALRWHAHARGTVPQFEFLLALHAVRLGWTVTIPDHEGAEGHWGAPSEPGYCTLDAVRATLSFERAASPADTPVALWGYSGGGLASSWAAEGVAEHAPELNVVGAVLGSPVGDPASAFLRLNGTPYAALPILVVAGLRRTYPDFDRLLHRYVTAEGLAVLTSVERMTTMAAIVRLRGYDFSRHTTLPLTELVALPEMVAIFDEIRPGSTAPDFPMLVVQATHDQIIAVDDVDGQVRRYRDAGASVEYLRDRTSEHITLLPLSVPLSLAWLADRVAGRPPGPGTTTTVFSIALQRRSVAGYGSMASTLLRAVLRRPIRSHTRRRPRTR